MRQFFAWLDKNSDIGVFLLRLFVRLRLLYGLCPIILSWNSMLGFRDFLQKYHFPLPLVSAVVSVYVQLIASLMVLLGWKIRYAALLLIMNFTVAWLMVDRHRSIEDMTPALAILFSSLLFLFQGAGNISVGKNRGTINKQKR